MIVHIKQRKHFIVQFFVLAVTWLNKQDTKVVHQIL